MGSFKSNGRENGRVRRGDREVQRRSKAGLEKLEDRVLLAVDGLVPRFVATSNDILDVKAGPLAKAGPHLITIFNEALNRQPGSGFQSSLDPLIVFKGDKVGVDISFFGDLNSFRQSVERLGMEVVAVERELKIVEGFLPVSQIRAVAELGGTVGIQPIYRPKIHQQGIADNQGDLTLRADVARQQFNVDGTGVKVGVLSDSANNVGGGLADSQATGDLPPNVEILADLPAGQGSDEGRAMMELIHDIAPGAALSFHSAVLAGPVGFGDAIRALANAGSQIIVDDIGFAGEPAFQDGIIGRAVNEVTNNQGVTYFSAAGNSDNSGYESPARIVQANVPGIGDGRFHDFDPGPGVLTTLPITVNQPGSVLFWFDNPFFTANGVVSDVDIIILDANNNIVAQGNSNNIATQVPQEFFAIPAAGNFQVAIRVTAGPDVGRVRFQEFISDITVSQQFGFQGGTFYPTTFGHPTAATAIGTGAVAWFDAPPVIPAGQQINSEPFSSFGPSVHVFDFEGNRFAQPQIRQKPDVSGPDGVNTTFFGQDIPQDPDNFPNFFGTSAAAPNLAAVGALMKQLVPTATMPQILTAMRDTATPLNGSAPGTFDIQGGFGLVDAVRAMSSIDQLRVVATTPANESTIDTAPNFVEIVFSKPVNPASLQSADLTFPGLPPGVSIVATAPPILVNPTTVRFPIAIDAAPGVNANGLYTFALADGSITALDGSALVGVQLAFTVSDVLAPRVTSTIRQGRILVVNFSEPMRPSTVNKANIQLVRTGGAGVFDNPANVVVTNDERAIFFYDAVNNRAIYDLRGVPQALLPQDRYAIVVSDRVTDVVGNRLDGNFFGQFPSGDGLAGGDFVQDLGFLTLQPPQIFDFDLAPGSDTGIANDRNTNLIRPSFSGIINTPFPGNNAGLQIAIQFLQDRPDFDLNVGLGGRGFTGTPDLIVNSDPNGGFLFEAPFDLRDGFHRVRIVVIGEADAPPLPGFSSTQDLSFRVDTTSPLITATSLPQNARVARLGSVSLTVADPIAPADDFDPLAVPPQLQFPGLDPRTANNISNYTLVNLGPDRAFNTIDDRDLSDFIASATYVDTTDRIRPSDPYTGRIDLEFNDGLPSGPYVLIVRTGVNGFQGLRDAAGNPLDSQPGVPGLQPFVLFFELSDEPAFLTQYTAISESAITPGTLTTSGPREFYEVPAPGFIPRAEAPPTVFALDFSTPLAPRDYTGAVQLIRSADAPGAAPDGDFGDGIGGGFTVVPNVSVTLDSQIPGTIFGQFGFQNRLVVRLPEGETLPPDHYRLVIPNENGQEIIDLFGNQADLQFLGNERPDGQGFEVFMPDGTFRPGLTGTGVQGGTFVTGFTVVPPQRIVTETELGQTFNRVQGNVIFARPDYVEDPFDVRTNPDGSRERPFPTLVPEASRDPLNPNKNLNSQDNFGAGFNPLFDRNANGRFDRSAFFEAELAAQFGPVVIVAQAGLQRPTPVLGEFVQEPFVIAAPSGIDPVNPLFNPSGSVPENTMLVMDAGSTLKMFNTSLFVQNQGSALQVRGGAQAGQRVTITSLNDDSIGGDTLGDGQDNPPRAGDWGGLVFRNYDDLVARGPGYIAPQFPVDGRLGRSGASDVMSIVNQATIRFGGSAVPQTLGTRFDTITLNNSRPAITNVVISDTGNAGVASGSEAAISVDVDALREDRIARGPLIRRTELVNNSINGILIRPAIGSLQAKQSDAVIYPDNPSTEGGTRNFVLDDPLPYVITSQLIFGQQLLQGTGGQTSTVDNRLYVQPGMMLKAARGASVAVLTPGASINIGDRTYIRQFDQNPNVSPLDATFRPNTVGDAKPLFTALSDDEATTFFFDPATGESRTIVPAIVTDNNPAGPRPVPGNVPFELRWGSLSIAPGAIAVIDEAIFRYGGGSVLTNFGTLPSRPVLDLTDDLATFSPGVFNSGIGANVSITNNDFLDNFDTPIVGETNQFLAADPLRPLLSGKPFLRGNVLQRNDINAVWVKTNLGVQVNRVGSAPIDGLLPGPDPVNTFVDTVWDNTDIVYLLRGTVILAGSAFEKPIPSATELTAEQVPTTTLTIQNALPDQLLANGEVIARPGEQMVVKLLNGYNLAPGFLGPGTAVDPDLATPAANNDLDRTAGAGFIIGIDDGVDPPASNTIPHGVNSQLRIIGIGANETLGQPRVPVVITSLRDSTVGPTVRGVDQRNTFQRDPRGLLAGAALSTPVAGDGGVIAFGSVMLTDYNLLDPRNGSLIDNADLRFLTRIDMQGGGLIDVTDINGDGNLTIADAWRDQKAGLATFLNQNNSATSMTISNSNLSTFRDAGVFVYPGFNALVRTFGVTSPIRAGLRGQPFNLFMVNNTIANMPVGVRINGETSTEEIQGQSPFTATFLHNTFYNNGVAIRTQASGSPSSHVYFLGMNNIFDGGPIGNDPNAAAVRLEGRVDFSELQFNLFNGYTTDVDLIGAVNFQGNKNPIAGNPNFFDAPNGNFFILPGSAAIDAALSELGPVEIGDALFPISDQLLNPQGGIRNLVGRNNIFGGFGFVDDVRKIVTLPGLPRDFRGFFDQWVPVRPGTPGATPGPATNIATYQFAPFLGERDQAGFLRRDDPNTPNIGFGSRPFFDVGAREFVALFPPFVTSVGAPDITGDGVGDGVFATIIDPSTGDPSLVNLYTPGAIAGVNRTPARIEIQFDKGLDPNTINNRTVILQASGGDGVFGSGNSTRDRSIDLSGRLNFDFVNRRLVIDFSGFGGRLQDDLYRIILVGTGSDVIRDPQGNALDGENLGPDGLPLPLPSGDGFPGGNFVLPFTIDTTPPAITPGSFALAVVSDAGPRDFITNINPPSFSGTILDTFALPGFLANQTVILDVDSNGDGAFDLIDVGRATTDAAGNFLVTARQPLPETPIGARSTARVRIVDTSGNSSNPNDPNAFASFLLDTTSPIVLGANPAPGEPAQVQNGQFSVTLVVNEQLLESSLRAPGAIQVTRVSDGVAVPVVPGSLQITFQPPTAADPRLIQTVVTFNVSNATVNDIYRVQLTPTVTDVATNPVSGPGGFVLDVPVFDPAQSQILFVGAGAGALPTGSRANPFPTITEGLTAARVGDVVAVLLGTYNEAIELKNLVRLVSAGIDSFEGNLTRGVAQQTIIRAPLVNGSAGATVNGANLVSIPGIDTELRGFTIASPLSGIFEGEILPDSIGINLVNSDILAQGNIILNAGTGIQVDPRDGGPRNARFFSNLIVGNLTGMTINDNGSNATNRSGVVVGNNTFAHNNVGLRNLTQAGSVSTLVVNNIFWRNRDPAGLSESRAIISSRPDTMIMASNLISANGPNPDNPADDLFGTPIDPSLLGPVPTVATQGNFTGNPAFVSAVDPRPAAGGPSQFLLNGNYNLTANSAAIDAANSNLAPPLDFLGRGRVDIPNRGFPGTGPVDVGAFEFQGGTGGGGGGGTPISPPPPIDRPPILGSTTAFLASAAPLGDDGSSLMESADTNGQLHDLAIDLEPTTAVAMPPAQNGTEAQRRAWLSQAPQRATVALETQTRPGVLGHRAWTNFLSRNRRR